MVMNAFGVQMGADHRLEFPAKKPFGKLQPNLVGQFRRYFPGSEPLHQMEALHAFFLVPHFFDAAHILEGGVYGAAESGLEQILLGFIFVEGLIDFHLQRFLIFPAGTFLLVEGIVDSVVEAVDGDHAGICHRVAPGRNLRPWFRERNRRAARKPFLFPTNCF